MEIAIVIPARYKSSRFPGKPLANINGKPMIIHVWENCVLALSSERTYIATDDDRIAGTCVDAGANVIMTPNSCLSGTDRVYHASLDVNAEVYINVQGDEPLLQSEHIRKIIDAADRNTVINAMCKINDERDFRSASVPKVVSRQNGELMYMSRAPIPTDKEHGYHTAYKQVCVYAIPAAALKVFATTKDKTPYEAIEDIEILRFLELNIPVRMVEIAAGSIAVDYPEDVTRVEMAINGQP